VLTPDIIIIIIIIIKTPKHRQYGLCKIKKLHH